VNDIKGMGTVKFIPSHFYSAARPLPQISCLAKWEWEWEGMEMDVWEWVRSVNKMAK